MPGAKKKQHYVPQFYLRKFADKFGGLFVFDKASKKSFKSNVRDVGNEKYFYNLPQGIEKSLHIRNAEGEEVEVAPELLRNVWREPNLDPEKLNVVGPDIIEKALSEIESEFSDLLNDLLYGIEKTGDIDPELKLLLSPFLALQFTRTLEYRRDLTDLWESMLGKMLRVTHLSVGKTEEANYSVSFDEEALPFYHAWFMLDPTTRKKLGGVLYHHIWTVKINRTEQPFYTSDTPIVKFLHSQEPGQSFGIGSPGIEINFPLTRNYVLSMYDRSVFHQLEFLDCKHRVLEPENVTHYNSLQVQQSYRHIFCPTDAFDLARQICEKEPNVYNPDRKRWG